jgi:3-oxoacyl-[acyl-carrier protein] reductase
MSPLFGKVALVTGASRGIGRATALALAKDGADVVVNYVSSTAAADEVVSEIGSNHALAIQADVSKREDITRLIKTTVDRFGKIDILVLNAGLLWQKGDLLSVTEDDFDKLFAANVRSPLFTVQEAVPHLADGGRVMLFSTSLAAFSGVTPNYLLYTASKGAIEQITRVLAKDLGRRGITVNTIAPGPVGTDAYFLGKTEQMVQLQSNLAPMGRLGKPQEVANVVCFIASDQSQWVNGQTIRINGGMTVG